MICALVQWRQSPLREFVFERARQIQSALEKCDLEDKRRIIREGIGIYLSKIQAKPST